RDLWGPIAVALSAPELRQAVFDVLGASGRLLAAEAAYPRPGLTRDIAGYEIPPHLRLTGEDRHRPDLPRPQRGRPRPRDDALPTASPQAREPARPPPDVRAGRGRAVRAEHGLCLRPGAPDVARAVVPAGEYPRAELDPALLLPGPAPRLAAGRWVHAPALQVR